MVTVLCYRKNNNDAVNQVRGIFPTCLLSSIHVSLASYPSANHTESSQLHRLPDAADLRQMCIITKSDLNRIHENLNRRQRDKDAIEQELARKKELAERSAQATKNWPNTIVVRRDQQSVKFKP